MASAHSRFAAVAAVVAVLICWAATPAYSYNRNSRLAAIDRRCLFKSSAFVTVGVSAATLTSPNPANAAFIGGPPMIKAWPELQYLVPIYELEGSLNFIMAQLDGSKGAAGVQRASRLIEQFFKGGLLSNKNLFKGLCAIYVNEIQFDDPDRGRVVDYRIAFLDDMEATIQALEAVRKPLKKLAEEGAEVATPDVLSSLEDARAGIRTFISRVPKGDVDRVVAWKEAVKAVDADLNGKMDENELKTLSDEDQKLWRAVGELLGA